MADNLRVKPIDVSAPGSFRERLQVMKALAEIREADNYIDGQLALDELLASRLETTDGSDLEEALTQLSAEEADAMVKELLVTRVPQPSAES